LTFYPVKSVSTLWAVADLHVAAQIELAHQAAVRDALSFIERHALFTRQGRNGVRQVNVTGLVTTAFTHRDSRAGDPDLHTHIAVANKVQTLDGRWLSIDGRVLFKATVTASETTTPPWNTISVTGSVCGSPIDATRSWVSGRCERSSASTPY
jgi:conjugative relaxase-like TrwC/TraI family protein